MVQSALCAGILAHTWQREMYSLQFRLEACEPMGFPDWLED